MLTADPLRILAVQKNNIGDLVLVTPFLAELRRRFPNARIDVLANSYNAAVLDRNRDIDHVFVYTKRKHRPADLALPRLLWQTVRLVRSMRDVRYDYLFLLNGRFYIRHLNLARLVAPKHIVGFVENPTQAEARVFDMPVPSASILDQHVVPRSLRLLDAAFPVGSPTNAYPDCHPCLVFPDTGVRNRLLSGLVARGLPRSGSVVALNISARRRKQRWPVERFARLARLIATTTQASLLVFWSPGDQTTPTHPGDDARAEALLAMCVDLPVFGCRTATLPEFIAGLSLADVVITSDGGAMHLSAACARPVIALFGDAHPEIWHPWCRSYRVVQSPSGDVSGIPAEDVIRYVERFLTVESLTFA